MKSLAPSKLPSQQRGFALVMTISLMVILTVLSVGLLTLSTISLRASGGDQAMATARANARLALMLAIGQLQKHAGPDQRVTARADILDAESSLAAPRLTGVWNSWEIKATSPPSASDYGKSEKDKKFRTWLASSPKPSDLRSADYVRNRSASPVTLWGKGTLGKDATPTMLVTADKVPLGGVESALAWAVMDEGVKARINTPHDDAAGTTAAKLAQLGSGERPATEMIAGLDGFEREMFSRGSSGDVVIQKGISRLNFSLAGETLAPGVRPTLQPLTQDLTTHSLGLFTDTARGGLKQDFSLLSNLNSLPSEYAVKGPYTSILGMSSAEAPSDPRWESLHQFSRIYRDRVVNTGGTPLLRAMAPSGWQAATLLNGSPPTVTLNRKPPPGPVLMPAIAKVQMLFSLIVRDIYNYPAFAAGAAAPVVPESAGNMHGPQDGHFRGTKYDYDLHLLYTPVVTLHNPYNVALEFRSMRLEFVHVPFAMQIFRNGIAQSRGLVPFETMFADNDNEGKAKTFGMNLKTKLTGRPGSTTFTLLPGEVKLFSPYIEPTRTYQQDLADRKFWDIYVDTGITSNIEAIPGWRGDGIGFDCDWLAGGLAVDSDKNQGRWESCLGIARDDQIHVEFAPLSASSSSNKFVIRMSALPTSTTVTPAVVSAIEMDYETPKGLQNLLLGTNGTLRYPRTGTVRGIDMLDHSSRPIKEIINSKPFALLSAQAKTTSGGRDASNTDGRFATKPWAFAHANIAASYQKVVSEHPANHSHEIDLQRLELGVGTANLLQVDQQDRGNFITGHSSFYGSKFGVQYDVPLGPMQSLASLNGANPGGSSGYLPRFAQPIGNSWAHPLLPPAVISQASTSGARLDHSFLLNLALYDRFYFSGLGDQTGAFGSGKSAATLATEFASGQGLGDPRLFFRPPDGQASTGLADLVTKPEAYTRAAAWQMMAGAFNINSTSVKAWTAMLASVQDPEALCNLLDPPNNKSALAALDDTDAREARISRLRLPVSESAEDGADPKRAYWLGPREYKQADLEVLAERIVEQVRKRGPFLSMAEFVNRRLGNDEMAQRGALQQAIDDSGLNQALALDADAGFEIPATQLTDYRYANAAAGAGPSFQGAPGYLSQADLLGVLGNAASARSDSFTIRGHGEARDPSGKLLASAMCEAVVQRVPEWLDPADVATALPAAAANKNFGRKFEITSFRWLSSKEI